MDLSLLSERMLMLFLTVAVGYTAAKCRVVDSNANRILADLVIYITNPATILYSVSNGEHVLTNGEVLLLTGIAAGTFAFLIGLSFLVTKLLRVPAAQRNAYRFMVIFSNVGFMGFPVVKTIWGPDAVFYAAIFMLVFALLNFTYGVALMSQDPRDHKFHWKILLQPMIVCSLLAYILYLTDAQPPVFVTDTLGFLDQITSPTCMLVIGFALADVPLRQVFANGRLYLLSALKLLVVPICTYCILRPFVTNELILGLTTVLMAMPVATNATLFAVKYNNNQALCASGVFLSTLLCVVTIPFVMWLLFFR